MARMSFTSGDGMLHQDRFRRYCDATQNARIVANAEKYYRAMVHSGDQSWNIRDRHMTETLETLLQYYGPDSKATVWAHNTHIGDYRGTGRNAGIHHV